MGLDPLGIIDDDRVFPSSFDFQQPFRRRPNTKFTSFEPYHKHPSHGYVGQILYKRGKVAAYLRRCRDRVSMRSPVVEGVMPGYFSVESSSRMDHRFASLLRHAPMDATCPGIVQFTSTRASKPSVNHFISLFSPLHRGVNRSLQCHPVGYLTRAIARLY